MGRSLCLGPAQKQRGSTSKAGLWSMEFQSLQVSPWVRVYGWGLGPAQLEGVSQCSGRALGVGVGLGLCMAGGRLQGQRIRPQSPTGSPVPKWTGKVLAAFPSIPLCPAPHRLPHGLPHPRWTPNRGWVPLGVGTPPLPQPPPRGAGPVDPAFTFAPASLPPTPSGPAWLEGA